MFSKDLTWKYDLAVYISGRLLLRKKTTLLFISYYGHNLEVVSSKWSRTSVTRIGGATTNFDGIGQLSCRTSPWPFEHKTADNKFMTAIFHKMFRPAYIIHRNHRLERANRWIQSRLFYNYAVCKFNYFHVLALNVLTFFSIFQVPWLSSTIPFFNS